MASDVGSSAGDERLSATAESRQGSPDRAAGSAVVAPSTVTDRTSLSVVVPTYNEEERIETCLESIFEACGDDPTLEVILVDSNSTDRTVELARQYPVTVYRIPDDDLTTPGAGRYVGQQAASGDQILFVDGDMRISGEWVDRAREVVRQRDDVAGVDGHLNTANATEAQPVEALRGVALYDADVLEQVDGFDPFLCALEDIELGYRITAEGYDVQRLPMVAASHPFSPGAAELLRRWRNGYYFGMGQAVRKNARSPRMLRKIFARYRYRTVFYCWVALGGVTALVQPLLLVAWLALSLALFAADASWEGVSGASERLGKYALSGVGFVRGLCMRPRDHEEFPLEVAELVAEPERAEA
jgi:glycosyltransferase involved in cell wall biosynthesis